MTEFTNQASITRALSLILLVALITAWLNVEKNLFRETNLIWLDRLVRAAVLLSFFIALIF